MVSAKKVARKAKRTAVKVEEPIPAVAGDTYSSMNSGTILKEPEVKEVQVKTSREPIKLHSAESSAWSLLDEAPAVPEVTTPQALNSWIDGYSRWKRKVAGCKR